MVHCLHLLVVMIHRLVKSILLLLLATTGGNAQVSRELDSSVQARAKNLEPFIIQSAHRYGIDPQILRVVCYLESRYRLEAISPKGARGPMQFMPETAARYALRNPHDPQTAIDAGARYLRDLLRKFEGRIDLALAAYNAGEGTVEAFRTGRSLRLTSGKVINRAKTITGGIPPYRETQEYVRSAIRFLINRGTVPTEFLGSSLRNTSKDIANPIRDFTIDAIVNESVPPLQLIKKDKSAFIEIP